MLALVPLKPALASDKAAVGERHGVAHLASASVRDAEHRDAVRYTVWYPSVVGVREKSLVIGSPSAPLFVSGSAALNGPVRQGKLPVLLLSHGNGGSARMMGWFGTALARAGYMVIAVDHPGNNGVDQMTLAGSTLIWERVADLAAALSGVQADSALVPHMDTSRIGVAGFSAGGFTALVAAGARVDLSHYELFCLEHPGDGVCVPQQESPAITFDDRLAAAGSPELAPYIKRADNDHAIAGIRAVFLMAPAMVQALAADQLKHLTQPVSIVLGTDDSVAPPATNGRVAAELIHGSRLVELAGVGHYDFLASCTDSGRAKLPRLCGGAVPRQQTHEKTIDQAIAFFASAMPSN
ncbi:alpha/beta hydrolase family protein [Frateuria aurantia]